MATLRRVTIAGVIEAEIPLDKDELTFGRDQDCDIVIGEKLVSRKHARIVRTAQGGHVLLDTGSDHGVMMGTTRVTHRELREGDVFQIGFARFQYTRGAAAHAAARKGGGGKTAAVVVMVLLLVGGAVTAVMLGGGKKSASTPAGGGGAASSRSSAELVALGAKDFLGAGRSLARNIETMNRAQQKLIEHAGAAGGETSVIDDDLRKIASAAMESGLTASQLGDTVALNDRGGDGQKLREQYRSVARASFALVIEAEDAREQLAKDRGSVGSIAAMIAEWGVRLWNPAVADAGGANPFASLASRGSEPVPVTTLAPVGPESSELALWMSTSSVTVTRRLTFAPGITGLRAAAMAKLAATGVDFDQGGGGATLRLFAGISMTELGEKILDGVATHVPGTATAVNKLKGEKVQAGVQDFLDGVSPKTIDPDNRPPVIIAAAPPPSVKVVIGRVNRPSDATGQVHVDVSWSGPEGTPGLTIVCQIPGYGNVETEGPGSGAKRVVIPLRGAPSGQELEIRCAAKDASGVEIGWKAAVFTPTAQPLVDAAVADGGAAAAAPVDAAEQPVAIDAAPAAAQPIDAAVDIAGDDSWIDPYVKSFTDDLLKKRPKDAAAIAIVAEDLRSCLVAAVKAGKRSAEAKQICAKALREGKDPVFDADGGTGGSETGGSGPSAGGGGWDGSFVGSLNARVRLPSGKTRSITVSQTLIIKQTGNRLVLTNTQGEAVNLTLSADGKSASGKAQIKDLDQTVNVTLSGDTLSFNSTFTDDEGGGGTMSGTLTRR